MYRAIGIALASALLILAPSEVFARGGGGHGGGGHGGGGFSGGHAGFSGGHMGRIHTAQVGPAGFRAMPGAWDGAHVNRHVVNRHVVAHRFHHRKKIFFIGGDGGYYYSCYPVWNGYRWVNSCGYDY